MFVKFPNPLESQDPDGLIAVGGKLDSNWIKSAYAQGIFPWPHEGYPLLWFSPPERGIIEFSELHLPTSFKKWMRKNSGLIELKWNEDFEAIIENCAKLKRKGQKGTWITDDMKEAYTKLFYEGYIVSLGCYQNNNLVGGIYGYKSTNYISLESMFHTVSNMSKYALYTLITELARRGHTWVDIQMVTSVTEQFGGKYIPRSDFLNRIKAKKI